MVLCRDPDAWKALRIRTMKEYGEPPVVAQALPP